MITGAHAIFFSQQADDVRAFFRDTLGFNSVDAGGGWLIFGLPPAEVAVHPAEGPGQYELYLLCDDINATVEELKAKGVEFSKPISDEGWGLLTAIRLPGDAELGIYEPRHPVAARGYRAASRPRTPRA
jgi:catechol 2,3-dioxygenase-like lactoylglutathione lyase family enzyme